MLKLSLASYDWALRHLIAEGDTDLFPSPFEISALRHSWPTIRKQLADTDVTNYAWRGGRRFVVPKKMLAFRVATQLDPLDSLILAALMYKYGPALEAHRIPISERRVFSHRLGRSGDGRLYADRPSWHDFWERVDYPRLSWLMRRLTQVGAPGGLDFILSNIARLSPILGPVSRYIMATVPNYNGDKNLIGAKILRALEYPIIKKSHYLQAILLDVIATLPELDHVDLVTARYGGSDPLVRREILRAAAIGARGDWLRDRKTEFRSMDPWLRRAFVSSSAALPEEEAHFWLQAVRDNLSPLEKVVASFAHKRKDLKLGEINITKL